MAIRQISAAARVPSGAPVMDQPWRPGWTVRRVPLPIQQATDEPAAAIGSPVAVRRPTPRSLVRAGQGAATDQLM
jgi:hypothetical protein